MRFDEFRLGLTGPGGLTSQVNQGHVLETFVPLPKVFEHAEDIESERIAGVLVS